MTINRYRANSLKGAIDKARADLGPEAKVLYVKQTPSSSVGRVTNPSRTRGSGAGNPMGEYSRTQSPMDADLGLAPAYAGGARKSDGRDHVVEIIAAIDDEARETSPIGSFRRPVPHSPMAYAFSASTGGTRPRNQDTRSKTRGSPESRVLGTESSNSVLQVLHECCLRNQVSADITYEILSLLNDEHNIRDQGIPCSLSANSYSLPSSSQRGRTPPFSPFAQAFSKLDSATREVRDYLSLFISKQINISSGLDMSKRTAILIGPTGVGKTTTMAKLASEYHFHQAKSVGLVTIDAYRIAAIDQLKTYAQIMAVPLKVALTPEELERCISDYSDMDLILVDTPGRSQFNSSDLRTLEEFLEAAQPADTHLLLSISIKESDAHAVVENFAPQYVRQLIFTKLDETASFGNILNICTKTRKPISYLTTGQNVPDDIEVAEVDRLVDLLLDAG